MKLKNLILLLLIVCFNFVTANDESDNHTFSDPEVRDRVVNMPLMFRAKYDEVVRSYINTYFVKARPKAAKIIGSTSMYFPIFEKYIKEKNLPADLRFLPILESALDPNAVSRSNAVGLWQFMESTGKEYGLDVNHLVDDRKDPHKASQAALCYLEKLYKRYGDWSLAIAAYNGGPGTVNRAIKRARSKNFWKIKKYLPRETRNYIPAFTAASYLFKYYEYHGISPVLPEMEMQMTDFMMIHDELSFEKISDITGIPVYTIKQLNPSYKKNIIPKSFNGNYLILPSWAIDMMNLQIPRPGENIVVKSMVTNRSENMNYLKTDYTVQASDNIQKVAQIFKCSPYLIKLWNNLRRDELIPGEKLYVYLITSNIPPKPSKKTVELINKLPEQNIKPIQIHKNKTNVAEQYNIHVIKKGESILEISRKYDGVSLKDILNANNGLTEKKGIYPGRVIKIPKG